MNHTIHVCYISLHLVDLYGKFVANIPNMELIFVGGCFFKQNQNHLFISLRSRMIKLFFSLSIHLFDICIRYITWLEQHAHIKYTIHVLYYIYIPWLYIYTSIQRTLCTHFVHFHWLHFTLRVFSDHSDRWSTAESEFLNP